jgi:phosphoglycolate phosphatase
VIADSIYALLKAAKKLAPKYDLQDFTKEDIDKAFDSNVYASLAKLNLPLTKIPSLIKDLSQELQKHHLEIPLHKDIKSALKKLSKYKLYIVTSNLSGNVKKYVEEKKINYFEDILGADIDKSKVKKINMIKQKYPDAEIYCVGDTVGDVKEGKRAKVKTIAAAWGFHKKERLSKAQPDFIADNAKQLVKILEAGP